MLKICKKPIFYKTLSFYKLTLCYSFIFAKLFFYLQKLPFYMKITNSLTHANSNLNSKKKETFNLWTFDNTILAKC